MSLGWLIYALVRALTVVIRLGMPFYDWQWYLAVVVLSVACLIQGLGYWPSPRVRTGVFGVLLVWLIVGYGGFWQTVALYPGRTDPIPISFWTSARIGEAPESLLEDLRSAGSALYLSPGKPPYDGETGQILGARLSRLAAHDIPVYLAPHASQFLSVPVHEEWMANTRKAAAFVRSEGLTNVIGMIADAEFPHDPGLDMLGLARRDVFRTADALGAFVTAMAEEYPDLSIGVTASWPAYFDSLDGDLDLSIVQRCPVDPPGNWEFINSMTYSSYYPAPWRGYYVYLIERAVDRRYPHRSPSHLIGIVGGGFDWEPLIDYDGLVRDARISRALGIREVVVFRLSSGLDRFGDDFVGQLTADVNHVPPDLVVPVPFSRPASALVYGMMAIDGLLDAWNWRGIFLIGWAALSGIAVRRLSRLAAQSGEGKW